LLAISKLQERNERLEAAAHEPVAIIGVACRLPGPSPTPEAYWSFLLGKGDAVGSIADGRWPVSSTSTTFWAALVPLESLQLFDAAFFGISPREAKSLDPQQRLLLEVSWEAMERAGLAPDPKTDSRTGVFVGLGNFDYQQRLLGQEPDAYQATGNMASIAAGRLSYFLGLRGPCMMVDTACSSSLTAIHLAVSSLRQRECDLALAGGANAILSYEVMDGATALQAFSPDGRCHTFDASANGYVRGEGCGMVVLKRLSEALRDGDPVWAVIRGSAVNQDGRSTGLTVPNVLAQQALLEAALANARVAPAAVGYVECHGTGTPLGDPIEVDALTAVLGQPRPDGSPCYLASVKTNIGHLEAGAGVAGLIKAVLVLRHGVIPPHRNFQHLNPRIDLDGTPFKIPTEVQPWPRGAEARIAGVSSFGMSGTNAHLIVEEAPVPVLPPPSEAPRPVHLLPLSARTPEALHEQANRYAGFLQSNPELSLLDVCHTAGVGRTHFRHRLAVVVTSPEQVVADLTSSTFATGVGEAVPRVAFLFTGQGSQYAGMGQALYDGQPAFRAAVDRCATILEPLLAQPLLSVLYPADGETSPISETQYTQPALFVLEYALTELWRSWGIVPAAVLGHSIGELVAAHVAGVFSLEDALALVAARGRLMGALPKGGSMVSVRAGEARVRALLDGAPVSVAAINGPESVVLSGHEAAVADVSARLGAEGVETKRLTVSHAFHSALMDPMLAEFERVAAGLQYHPPRLPLVSNLTGALAGEEVATPAYWVRHVREAVRFADGMQTLAAQRIDVFLEVGPQPHLSGMGAGCIETTAAWLPSLRSGKDAWRTLLESLGQLYVRGAAVDWAGFDRPYPARKVVLPTYPFQRERYWIELPKSGRPGRPSQGSGHPLLGVKTALSEPSGSLLWECEVDPQALPWLPGFQREGSVVLPETAYLDMAMVAGREAFQGGSFTVEEMEFPSTLPFASGQVRQGQMLCTLDGLGQARFRISGLEPDGSWTLHAQGRLQRSTDVSVEPSSLETIQQRCTTEADAAGVYSRLNAMGRSYGPTLQGLVKLWSGPQESLAEVRLPAEVAGEMDQYQVHPVLLDVCMHGLLEEGASLTGVRMVRRYRPPTVEAWSHWQGRVLPDGSTEGDLRVLDTAGQVVMELLGVHLEIRRVSTRKSPDEALYLRQVWERTDLGSAAAGPTKAGAWLVLQDGGGVGEAVAAGLQARGETVVTLPTAASTDPQALDAGLQEMAASGRPGRGVVHLCSLDTTDATDFEAAATRGCGSAMLVVQALSRTGWRDMPRLWLVTRRSQTVGSPDPALALAQAPLWGMARSLSIEQTELQPTRIDLGGTDSDVERLLAELQAGSTEEEVAFRSDGRYVARLVRGAPPELTSGEVREPAGGRPFRVDIDRPGALEHLTLRATEARPPGSGEVGIAVEAAGLNYRDVLMALGTVTLAPLGSECVGRVMAVGDGVDGLTVGQLVMALAPGSLASQVMVPAALVRPVPAHLSPVEAATFSMAHLTAWHALHHVARLEAGERVLIHAAAGGIGQAALQWARHVGADIYATAGTPEKRAWLHAQGVEHVSDSRSLQFVDDVLAWTHGEGVDVVLNSLSGTLADKSLTLLRDGGRFVELGPRLGMSDIHNVSSSRVDLAALIRQRPHQVRAWWDEVVSWAEQGVLRPLSHRTVPVAQVTEAFRTMAQGGHTGKLVVTLDDPEVVVAVPRATSDQVIRPDGTYLVTGGVGGLGLELTRWLVAHGARHLLLLSRRGATGEAAQAVADLQAAGVQVVEARADVGDRAGLAAALATAREQMPPLRGVMHLAGVFDVNLLLQQTLARVPTVMAPKVTGTWNLHELTLDAPLDFFVFYSSISTMLATEGLGMYAAANTFLDALSHYRHAHGLPALSVGWTMFSQVGGSTLMDSDRANRLMRQGGLRTLTPQEGLEALGRLLGTSVTHVGMAPLNMRQWREFNPRVVVLSILARLLEEAPVDQARKATFLETWLQAPPSERAGRLVQFIQEEAARVVGMDPARLGRRTPFQELGFDSLMAMELRNRLEEGLKLRLPATLLWTYPDIATVHEYLTGQLDNVSTAPAPAAGGDTDLSLMQKLSEAEMSVLVDAALAATEGLPSG
jgi:polyketide synthase 12/epothilone polyketide synthase D